MTEDSDITDDVVEQLEDNDDEDIEETGDGSDIVATIDEDNE